MLNDLFKKVYDKGVEWVELEKIFFIKNGYTPSKSNINYWSNGDIPWFRMEDIRENGNILEFSKQYITKEAVKGNKLFQKNSIIISTTATIGEYALIKTDYLANQQFTNLTLKNEFKNILNIEFIFHYMFIISKWCKDNVNTSGFSSVNMSKFKQLKIPLPPIELQNEIVKILDNFTELEKELEKELELRKKQYEYYRNKLLTFADDVEWVELGVISEIKIGKQLNKNYLYNNGLYPVINGGIDVSGKYNEYNTEKNNITISQGGASAGFVNYIKENFWAGAHCYVIFVKNENIINKKFLYYFLKYSENYLMNLKQGAGIPGLNRNSISNFKIPLPPLATQEKIVEILDKFDKIVNDISEGLPAEISARKKQYEYYRNKLLTFKEK